MSKIALTTCLLLPACAAQAATTFLYTQPSVDAIAPILINNPSGGPTPNIGTITTYGIGATTQVPAWDVSAFTGLQIPAGQRAVLERTVDAGWLGATAVQAYQDRIAFQLHTNSSPYVQDRPLKTINFGLDFSDDRLVRPWGGVYGADAKLCMGFSAAVPSSWSGEGSTNYSGANFSLRDITSNKWFTIGAILFSTAPVSEYVGFDGGTGATNVPMVATYYGSQELITTSPGSASVRSSIWKDDTWFGYCLTRQNIEKIVNQVNTNFPGSNFSVANLVLGSAHIGTEIATGTNGLNNGHMAARFGGWNILIEH
ncbi:hypothetical protein [Xanthomonas tesorieronis]|uniref:hypothetical protein n=1 Tax=Xanthomonas tesorieronis TaxID=3160839 RepID=UPI0035139587